MTFFPTEAKLLMKDQIIFRSINVTSELTLDLLDMQWFGNRMVIIFNQLSRKKPESARLPGTTKMQMNRNLKPL